MVLVGQDDMHFAMFVSVAAIGKSAKELIL